MNDNLKQALHPEYELLPETIKYMYTNKEYMWLGSERDRLIERETQPDMDYTE